MPASATRSSTAAAKGWKTEQVEAEIKQRTNQLTSTYHDTFAANDDHQDTLEQDLRGALHDGQLDLALAEKTNDRTGADAAALKIEHESMWTSDEKVNELLKGQYRRAQREVMRDQAVAFQHEAAGLPRDQRAALWKSYQQDGEVIAEQRARGYIGDLKTAYDQGSRPIHRRRHLLPVHLRRPHQRTNSPATPRTKPRNASPPGQLSDEEELKYAIFGPGANEKTIRETLKGKSKIELAQLAKAYEKLTGNDLRSDLEGDLAGRDEADMTFLLDTGDSTPEERLAYLDKRTGWEVGGGTGVLGGIATDEEAQVLLATNREAQAAYKEYERLNDRPEDDPSAKPREPASNAGSATATRTSTATAKSSTGSPTPSRWPAPSPPSS